MSPWLGRLGDYSLHYDVKFDLPLPFTYLTNKRIHYLTASDHRFHIKVANSLISTWNQKKRTILCFVYSSPVMLLLKQEKTVIGGRLQIGRLTEKARLNEKKESFWLVTTNLIYAITSVSGATHGKRAQDISRFVLIGQKMTKKRDSLEHVGRFLFVVMSKPKKKLLETTETSTYQVLFHRQTSTFHS